MAFLPGVSRPGPLLEFGGVGMICLVVIDTPDATLRMAQSRQMKSCVFADVPNNSGRAAPVTAQPSELTDPLVSERDARGGSGRAVLAVIAALVPGLVAVRVGLAALARASATLTVPPVTRRELPGPRILELPHPRPRSTGAWWRVLLIGLLLYALGVGVLVLTGNPNLFPTVFLLGNFLVPVSYVARRAAGPAPGLRTR
jgi:hypothetical protein